MLHFVVFTGLKANAVSSVNITTRIRVALVVQVNEKASLFKNLNNIYSLETTRRKRRETSPMASEETKTPTLPVTSGIEAENAIEIKNFNEPRTSVVTELQLSDISDDVGNCWRELGPKLDISAAKIQNLDDDYRCNRGKANALLLMWKQKEGNSAVAGRLADALVSIGKKCIAEMLLGVDNTKMLRCGNIPKGHVISLTVIHDLGEGLDKLMVCEDAQGNKFMVKAFNSRDNFLKLEETLVSKRFLETVVVARQESLKRYISSELQDLRLQMKKGQLACGNVDKTDTIQDASKDKTEPTSSLLNEEVDTPNDESVEKLLQSCEEHRNHFQNMFEALIKLTAEAGQQSEDDVDCVQKLLDFTMELQQKGITLFSKIESVGTQSQLKDQQHTNRFEDLHKWKTQLELQIKEVEKLLLGLLHQRTTDRKPSYKGRLPSHQKTVPKRRSNSLPGYRRKSPTDYSEGDLPKETRTKVRYSLYDRVNTVKARKIMNSYETNDSAFFYFFLFVFQESLVEAEIGRQKPSSDEEHQKIDSGARYSTKEF
ncbi:unnamed protein product, partial [Pocillopora meandrina]